MAIAYSIRRDVEAGINQANNYLESCKNSRTESRLANFLDEWKEIAYRLLNHSESENLWIQINSILNNSESKHASIKRFVSELSHTLNPNLQSAWTDVPEADRKEKLGEIISSTKLLANQLGRYGGGINILELFEADEKFGLELLFNGIKQITDRDAVKELIDRKNNAFVTDEPGWFIGSIKYSPTIKEVLERIAENLESYPPYEYLTYDKGGKHGSEEQRKIRRFVCAMADYFHRIDTDGVVYLETLRSLIWVVFEVDNYDEKKIKNILAKYNKRSK